jgi:hypothetical protein
MTEITEDKKDNVIARTKRGFKVMCDKLSEWHKKLYATKFIKNIQEQNESSNSSTENNPFATDLSNQLKVDF